MLVIDKLCPILHCGSTNQFDKVATHSKVDFIAVHERTQQTLQLVGI